MSTLESSNFAPYYLYTVDPLTTDEINDLTFSHAHYVLIQHADGVYMMKSAGLLDSECATVVQILPNAVVEANIDHQLCGPFEISNLLSDPLVCSLILAIRKELKFIGQDITYLNCLSSALIRHVRIVLNQTSKKGHQNVLLTPYQMTKLTAYVTDRMNKVITLDELSGVLDYSPFHFCRIFKKTNGLTPANWIKDLKMITAMHSLYSNKYNVAQVADMVGYTNKSHFSRVFKEKYGSKPSEILLN